MEFRIFNKKLNSTDLFFLLFLVLTYVLIVYSQFKRCTLGINCTLVERSIKTALVLTPITALWFLAYKDFKTMEVDNIVSLVLLVVLLVFNLLLFFFNVQFGEPAWKNLLGAICLGAIFQLIVLLTKEKGLGQGDVRIAIISGLMIGSNNLILWTYITVFSALIYGIILAIRKKQFRGLKIPFVPFMAFGTISILVMSLLG